MKRFLKRNKPVTGRNEPKFTHSLLALLCAAINGVIGMVLLFDMRVAIMATVDRSNIRAFAINFVDIIVSVILGIMLLVAFIVLQHLYEKDFSQGIGPKRFLISLGIQIALYGVIFLYTNIIIWGIF